MGLEPALLLYFVALAYLWIVVHLAQRSYDRQFKACAAKAEEQRRREENRRSRAESYLRRAIEETDETKRKFASQRAVYWMGIAQGWGRRAKQSEKSMKRADFLR